MYNILHISEDSVFMPQFAFRMHQVAPDASEYFVIANRAASELQFPLGVPLVRTVHKRSASLILFLLASRRAKVIVAHMMTSASALAFLASKPGTARVWSGFGADYYHVSIYEDIGGMLEERTAAEYTRLKEGVKVSALSRTKMRMKTLLYDLASRRATHFSAPIPNDLEVFKRRFPKFAGQYLQLNYASTSNSADLNFDERGTNVLVGNSATYTNNHLDIFAQLAKVKLDGRQVIVPLNYGDNDQYRDVVLSEGYRIFGSDFRPITEFIPGHEYEKFVRSCGHLIMGHRRQQGLGNIILALSSGLDVVLNGGSPVFSFLRDRGAHVRELSRLAEQSLAESLPTQGTALHNLHVVQDFWGEEIVQDNLSSLVALLKFQEGQRSPLAWETN